MTGNGWIIVRRKSGERLFIGQTELVVTLDKGQIKLAIHPPPGVVVRRVARGELGPLPKKPSPR